MISTCIDDFYLAGTQGFVEMVTEKLSATLDVSKVEDDSFIFTGIDIKKVEEGIEISMEDYAKSLEEVQIRDTKADDPLTRDELKVLRKFVGKLNWLAANTRPDLAIYALELAKKQKKAMVKDLREINKVLKKVREKDSRVLFTKVGKKDELIVMGVSYASYHHDDRSVAGELIMLGNQKTGKAAPIYCR